MVIEDLYGYLSDQGTAAATRIYPNALPQGVILPAIRYFQVSSPGEHTQDGRSRLRHARFQFDCFAGTYLEARRLAEQVAMALDGYRGVMGEGGYCDASFQEDERDNYDPETERHWVSLDMVIWHS